MPTGTGKTFISYGLVKHYVDQNKRILFTVPKVQLVKQTQKNFQQFSEEISKDTYIIHGGISTDAPEEYHLVISTWQSIYKEPREWFKKFDVLISDECHSCKAPSLKYIANSCINADNRHGLTGTLDGVSVNELLIQGLFGPVCSTITISEAQSRNFLASLNIQVIRIKYEEQPLYRMSYEKETTWSISNNNRNNFIINLALSLEGNTLVLFERVEKHGEVLFDLLKKKQPSSENCYFISGKIDIETRENIRNSVENEDKSIIIASYKTFATGIDIKNLHNIIFASAYKSKVLTLQAIGRGLRISDKGTTLYDCVDDLRQPKTQANYGFIRSLKRLEYYRKEQQQVKINTINL